MSHPWQGLLGLRLVVRFTTKFKANKNTEKKHHDTTSKPPDFGVTTSWLPAARQVTKAADNQKSLVSLVCVLKFLA